VREDAGKALRAGGAREDEHAFAAFEARYPFIKVTFWRGESEDIATRVGAEIRANNVICDVMEGTGVGELAARANVIQPFYSPVLGRYPKTYRDPQHL
jgi:ABC-type Fe3+ transport system substrate-binding protein